jgi:hypothetical protein
MKISKLLWISMMVLLVFSSSWGMGKAEGDSPQAALGTGFTYQGYLKDNGGNPLTATCSFRFQLWDAFNGGTQIGSSSVATGVDVVDGYFTAGVNTGGEFGASAFNGQARWLAVGVQCTGDSTYVMLEPRQLLTAVPYAGYAVAAGSVSWSGVTGTPLQLPTGCSSGELPKWNGTAWACSNDNNTTYTAGTGLSLAGTQFSVTGAPWSGLTGVPAGFSDNTDNDTTYSSGFGLAMSGTTFNVDDNLVQRRVNGSCGLGFTIRQVNQDGTVLCQVDSPTNRAVPPMNNVLSTVDRTGGVGRETWITIGTDGLGLISYLSDDGDLIVAHCLDLLCTHAITSTLEYAGSAYSDTSITIGADGLGLISYYDAINGDLVVAHCSDLVCSTAITTTLDYSGNVGEFNSITISPNGLGLISYFDSTGLGLRMAFCWNIICSAAVIITLDYSSSNIGLYNSIAIGTDGLPLISYHDVDNYELRVAHCSRSDCATVTFSAVDSDGDVGYDTSITIGADGLGLISYGYDTDYDTTPNVLKVAHCENITCTTTTNTILDNAGDVGINSSITLGADGLGLISYYDSTNGNLKIAHCLNIACTDATLITLDSDGNVGDYTSITIGSDGLGLISYYDITNHDLKVAHCSNTYCVPFFRRH